MFYAPFPWSQVPFFRLSGFLPTQSAVTVYLCCVSRYPRALLDGGPRWTGCKGFQTCPVSMVGWVIWKELGPHSSPAMFCIVLLSLWSEVRSDWLSSPSSPRSPRRGALPETAEETHPVSPGDGVPTDPGSDRPVISYHLPDLESFRVLQHPCSGHSFVARVL